MEKSPRPRPANVRARAPSNVSRGIRRSIDTDVGSRRLRPRRERNLFLSEIDITEISTPRYSPKYEYTVLTASRIGNWNLIPDEDNFVNLLFS